MTQVNIAVRMNDGTKQLFRADADDHEALRGLVQHENKDAATVLIEIDCTRPMVDQVAA